MSAARNCASPRQADDERGYRRPSQCAGRPREAHHESHERPKQTASRARHSRHRPLEQDVPDLLARAAHRRLQSVDRARRRDTGRVGRDRISSAPLRTDLRNTPRSARPAGATGQSSGGSSRFLSTTRTSQKASAAVVEHLGRVISATLSKPLPADHGHDCRLRPKPGRLVDAVAAHASTRCDRRLPPPLASPATGIGPDSRPVLTRSG
jgi:hypothetical protein